MERIFSLQRNVISMKPNYLFNKLFMKELCSWGEGEYLFLWEKSIFYEETSSN